MWERLADRGGCGEPPTCCREADVNRTFLLGLLATGVGVGAGLGYRFYLGTVDRCAGLFGVAPRDGACTPAESWTAFVNVFSLTTLVLTLVAALVSARVHREEEGYVSLGDSLITIGTIVSLVTVVVFAVFGAYLGIAYGVGAVALTLFALKQDRHGSMGAAALMSLFVVAWLGSDPSALLLGFTPAVLWIMAALSYASSLRLGEALVAE